MGSGHGPLKHERALRRNDGQRVVAVVVDQVAHAVERPVFRAHLDIHSTFLVTQSRFYATAVSNGSFRRFSACPTIRTAKQLITTRLIDLQRPRDRRGAGACGGRTACPSTRTGRASPVTLSPKSRRPISVKNVNFSLIRGTKRRADVFQKVLGLLATDWSVEPDLLGELGFDGIPRFGRRFRSLHRDGSRRGAGVGRYQRRRQSGRERICQSNFQFQHSATQLS